MANCYVCGNSVDNIFYTVSEMMYGFRDKFSYFECCKCGCLQISDTNFDISKYYPSDYYSFGKIQEKKFSAFWNLRAKYELFSGNMIDNLVYQVLRKISGEVIGLKGYSTISKVHLTKNSKILDVGCGSGWLLYVLRNLGFKNLLGCDPYMVESLKYNNGLEILKESLQNIKGKWDLIMFQHSFEHMANPLDVLQSVFNLLSENGLCIIRVPTTSSYAWKHYGINWVQLDAPRHFFLHSINSLKLLADKANLKLKEVVYDSTDFQFWGSEQYLQNIPLISERSLGQNPLNSMFSQKQIAEFSRKAIELNKTNQGDQAAFFCAESETVDR